MYSRRIIKNLCVPSIIGIAALLSACGGGGGSTTARGSLQVSLTDAPACGYDQVNVTVSRVRAHQSAGAGENDSGWQDIVLSPARKINLLTLTNGVMQELGQTDLPAGRYTQLRLVLTPNSQSDPAANSVVVEGTGTEVALETPSAIQSGIKLNHPFEVVANEQVSLVLDFDACKSVVTKGNGGYSLKPVIGVIPKATSGGITGFVTTGLTRPVVSAQQDGIVVRSTVPDANGAFTLSPLPQNSAGYVVVVTADGGTTAAITGVPVTIGASTPVSTSSAPIALSMSSMRTVSGTTTPVNAQALVRATQTYSAGGPRIEVAFKSADLSTGAYTLSLPTAAPLLGRFGTLPIPLAVDSASAGKYIIETSATGYTSQTFNADLSTADVARNVTLTP